MRREDFPILTEKVHGRELVYLDNAATTQKPQAVLDAIVEGYSKWNANVHRGVHHLSQVATEKHEQARKKVAEWLNADSEEIIFTKGTTDGINMLARSFGDAMVNEGDEIIVSELEHHSNIVPWQMLCERKKAVLKVIPLREDLSIDIEAFKEMLNERTRLVSVAQVSNVLGIVNPVEEIIRYAHAKHIPVCVDGAQSVPHLAVDVKKMDCDFLVMSAHKMYGPTGLGVLYGKKEWLDKLPPAEGGGEMIEHVRWDKTTYNVLPYKFEAGTPNYIGSYAFSKAIEYVQELGIEEIAKHEEELVEYIEERLSGLERVKIYAARQKKAGAVSFNVYRADGGLIHPFDVGVLLDRQGVAVRTGHHCAEPLIEHLGVPGTLRASVGLYNTKEDIDKLIAALERAIMMLE
ncbi:MAG: SufS family cysteine desulfurase [Paludibacteraceae bacterium]|nr:SufS family cysteine desulfurase [Paludibacteraceae bacterium]